MPLPSKISTGVFSVIVVACLSSASGAWSASTSADKPVPLLSHSRASTRTSPSRPAGPSSAANGPHHSVPLLVRAQYQAQHKGVCYPVDDREVGNEILHDRYNRHS
jgi:hypothetical protein